MSRDPFAGFRSFESAVLDGLRAGERSAQKFKQLIGTINDTLVTTHRLVIARLEALESASDLAAAREALAGLRAGELTEAFRIEGLCDLLGGLGQGLWARTCDAQQEGLFGDDQLEEVGQFAQMLYDRETEVAWAYARSLVELLDRGPGLDDGSLAELRAAAASVRARLTDDVSDFEAKATIFKRVSVP